MVTDPIPKTARLRDAYTQSDGIRGLELPADDQFVNAARLIEEAMTAEETGPVRKSCLVFLSTAAEFYHIAHP